MNIPFRFRRGEGLERSPNLRQKGHQIFENVDLRARDIIRKRDGAESIALVRSGNPSDLIPADRIQALWFRDRELVLEDGQSLYSRRTSTTGQSNVNPGTATPTEITNSQAQLNTVFNEVTLNLPSDANVNSLYNYMDRNLLDTGKVVWTGRSRQVRALRFSVDTLKLELYDNTGVTLLDSKFVTTAGTIIQQIQIVSDRSTEVVVWLTYLAGSTTRIAGLLFTSATGNTWDATNPIIDELIYDKHFGISNSFVGFLTRSTLDPSDIIGIALNKYTGAAVVAINPVPSTTVESFCTYAHDPVGILGSPVDYFCYRRSSGRVTSVCKDRTGAALRSNSDLSLGSAATNLAISMNAANTGVLLAFNHPNISNYAVLQSPKEVVFTPNNFNYKLIASRNSTQTKVTVSITGVLQYLHATNGTFLYPNSIGSVTTSIEDNYGVHLVKTGTSSADLYYGRTNGSARIINLTSLEVNSFSDLSAGTITTQFGRVRSPNRDVIVWGNATNINVHAGVPTSGTASKSTGTLAITLPFVLQSPVAAAVFGELSSARVDLRVAFQQSNATNLSIRTWRGVSLTFSDANDQSETLPTTPTKLGMIASGTQPRTIISIQYGNAIETYESGPTPDIFILVDPAPVVLSGGNWQRRGPWTRGITKEIPAQKRVSAVRSALGIRVPINDGAVAELSATDTTDGIIAVSKGDATEDVITIDAIGRDIKGGIVSNNNAVLAWQTGENMESTTWIPGATSFPAPTNIFANIDVGTFPKRWDFDADDSTGVCAWFAIRNNATLIIRARAANGLLSAAQLLAGPTINWTTRHAAAVWVQPRRTTAGLVRIFWAASGTDGANVQLAVGRIDFNDTTGIFSNESNRLITPITESAPQALAIYADPTDVATNNAAIVALEHTNATQNRVIFRRIAVVGTTNTIIRTKLRTVLSNQFVPLSDEITWRGACVLQPAGDGILQNCQLLYDPINNEYVARSWIGHSKITRQVAPVQTNSITHFNNRIVWASDIRETPQITTFLQNGLTELDLTPKANTPADVGGVVISAHAGYPRAYDGVNIFENDWHILPVINSLTGVAAGGLVAGTTYGVAVTWEWSDQSGRVYRSAPTIKNITLGAGQNQIAVSIFVNNHSEKTRLTATVWRTESDGEVFFRDGSIQVDGTGSETVSINLLQSDADILDNEQLFTDDIGGGQAQITGICTLAGGRLWGRNTKYSNIAQFSQIPDPGQAFGVSWSNEGYVETYKNLTAIGDVEGRILFFDENGISWTQGDGPDNNGDGAYPLVRVLPVEIGCTGQETVSRLSVEIGTAFGSTNGIRIINRNLSVDNLSERIERFYELEGARVVACLYDPARGELVILDDGPQESPRRTLRYHIESQRWATDSDRRGRALALAKDNRYAILTIDGRILIQNPRGEGNVYTPYLSFRQMTGLVPSYLFAGQDVEVLTGNILIPSNGANTILNDLIGVTGTLSYDFSVVIDQSWIASATTGDLTDDKSILITVSFDLDALPVGTGQKLLGKQDPITGAGYVVDLLPTGPRLRLRDTLGTETTISLTTASYVLNQRRQLTLAIDRVNSLIKLSTDIEQATPVVWNPSLIYSNSEPFKLGATIPGTSSFDGQIDFVGIVIDDLTNKSAVQQIPGLNDIQTLCANIRDKFLTGTGITSSRLTSDGGLSYKQDVGVIVRLEPEDGTTHTAFSISKIRLSGEYEGSHSLNIEVYKDYDFVTPYKTYRKNFTQIDEMYIANPKKYIFVAQLAEDTFYHAVIRVTDDGESNATFILGEIDVEVEVVDKDTPSYVELPEEHFMDEV